MNIDIYPDTEREYQWLYDNGFVLITWDELEDRGYNDKPIPELSFKLDVEYDRFPADPSVGAREDVDVHTVTYMNQTKHPDIPDWLQQRIEDEL